MHKLRFSIDIDAPRDVVWDTMLGDATYRVWSAAFMPGSHYVGEWKEGSRMLFLAPMTKGESGMVSRVRSCRPHEYVSVEHFGLVEDGKEDTSSEAVKAWAGAREDYTFNEVDGKTQVVVEMDVVDEYREMMENTWAPRAADAQGFGRRPHRQSFMI